MASATNHANDGPQLHQSFRGSHRIEQETLHQRRKIAEMLIDLRQEVQKLGRSEAPVSVSANITIHTSEEEHVYHVDIGKVTHDVEPLEEHEVNYRSPSIQEAPANGASPHRSRKRLRTTSLDQSGDHRDRPMSASARAWMEPSMQSVPPVEGDTATLMNFMKEWRQQWVQQGGWMYDQLNGMKEDERRKKAWLQTQFETHAGGLATTVNSHFTQTQAILNNLSNAIPWLENNRKVAHDASEAREEKWRMSSANFHDQTRKDREAAEKIALERYDEQMEALQKQRAMLVQLIESQGIDLEE